MTLPEEDERKKEVGRLKRRIQELEALNRVSQAIASTVDVNSILRIIVDEASALTGAEQGSIFVTDEQSPGGMTTLLRGVQPDDHSLAHMIDAHLTGWIIHNKKPLVVDDLADDPRFPGFKGKTYPVKAALSVPLVVKDAVIGAIHLSNKGGKLFSEDDVRLVNILSAQSAQLLENARLCERISQENIHLKKEVEKRYRFGELIGQSTPMQKVFALLERITSSEANVVIHGESGTGKELVARAIHYNGPRKDKRFVAVDCGALPETLLESELFGYVQGAFTGATKDKIGLFEEAEGGTLFLDEISNMALPIQGKLLRAIQEKEIRPVGATTTKKVDVRLISASSSDLFSLVQDQKFREDLYYRLNVVAVAIPTLRERKEDISMLAYHFLSKYQQATKKKVGSLASETMNMLEAYRWPGNVRELENVIERAVALAAPEDETIGLDLLPGHILESTEAVVPMETHTLNEALDRVKRRMVLKALERHNWNKTKAAESLGISRLGLSKMLKKMKINE
jgi:transcriptional regulator with GAF, ATPase, and Fis domain